MNMINMINYTQFNSDINLAEKSRLILETGLTSIASQMSAKYSTNIPDGSIMPTQCNKKRNV